MIEGEHELWSSLSFSKFIVDVTFSVSLYSFDLFIIVYWCLNFMVHFDGKYWGKKCLLRVLCFLEELLRQILIYIIFGAIEIFKLFLIFIHYMTNAGIFFMEFSLC